MLKHFRFLILFLLLITAQQAFATQSMVPSQAHRAREAEYDMHFFFPDLTINYGTTFIWGHVLMSASVVAQTMDTFAVELSPLFSVDSMKVSLNGAPFVNALAATDSQELNVLLPFTAHQNDDVQVLFYYHGFAPLFSTNAAGAMYNGYQQCYSVTEPYYAFTLFPCKQVLTDKIDSSWFNITTDDPNAGISNGVLQDITDLGNGTRRYEWRSHHAIDYYLVSFAVGNFVLTTRYFHPEGRTDSMQVQFYDFANSIDTLYYRAADNSLHIFSKLFGLYPFYDEKLSYTNINYGGGMENQTAISLTFNPVVIAHETAHQWFGDNVTCASFKDVMLNEGFAHWCESIYAEFNGGGDSARIICFNSDETMVIPAIASESGYDYGDTSTIYGPFDAFTDYAKNGMMINTLRFWVNNDSLFFQALRNYQSTFGGSTAYATNLRAVMEQATGLQLTDFFNQFYYGFGYPIFSYRWNQETDTLILHISETTSCDSTPLFVTALQIKLLTSTGDTLIKVMINNNETEFFIPISGAFDTLYFDPNQWILNDAGPGTFDTTLRDTVTKPISAGIMQTTAATAYTIFPNPTSNYINIMGSAGANEGLKAILFNTFGQPVYQTQTRADSRIYLPQLANGVYILQLNGADRIRVEILN